MRDINKVVKILILSDFFFNSSFGLFNPIFALFIAQEITGSTLKAAEVAGFSVLFYWVIKSAIQVPFGKYLDKDIGERDDFWFMFAGHFIVALVPIGYIFASLAWHIYLIQVVLGLGMAMIIPPWYAIFSKHIDKGHEAYEWGISSTVFGLAFGITGALGGLIVSLFNFEIIFVLASAINIFSAIVLLIIKDDLYPIKKTEHKIPHISIKK